MAEICLDDRTARAHITLYSEVYQQYRSMLIKDKLIIIAGEAVEDDYYDTGNYVKAEKVFNLSEVRTACGRLRLCVNNVMMENNMLQSIKDLLGIYRGRASLVVIEYNKGSATGQLNLGETWRVEISDKLMDELQVLLGAKNVRIEYRNVKQFLYK
jgi:DNA polymerase-3 subunit alpha